LLVILALGVVVLSVGSNFVIDLLSS
jgi:hypothetical protein